MIKKNNKGFMLAETLVVTVFVAGVLIYLFIQFTNLNQAYEETYIYNTVEGLYALEDVKDYIESDNKVNNYIPKKLDGENKFIKITFSDSCKCVFGETTYSCFQDSVYCKLLLESENIKNIFVTYNYIPKDADFSEFDLEFQKFIGKITPEGTQTYRLVAQFNNSTYATVRFGD